MLRRFNTPSFRYPFELLSSDKTGTIGLIQDFSEKKKNRRTGNWGTHIVTPLRWMVIDCRDGRLQLHICDQFVLYSFAYNDDKRLLHYCSWYNTIHAGDFQQSYHSLQTDKLALNERCAPSRNSARWVSSLLRTMSCKIFATCLICLTPELPLQFDRRL